MDTEDRKIIEKLREFGACLTGSSSLFNKKTSAAKEGMPPVGTLFMSVGRT